MQAAALNKSKAVLTAEESQVAPHFAFLGRNARLASAGVQVIWADVGGHLALQIFFRRRHRRALPSAQSSRNKRQRQTRRGGGLARRKWCKCHNDILNCFNALIMPNGKRACRQCKRAFNRPFVPLTSVMRSATQNNVIRCLCRDYSGSLLGDRSIPVMEQSKTRYTSWCPRREIKNLLNGVPTAPKRNAEKAEHGY